MPDPAMPRPSPRVFRLLYDELKRRGVLRVAGVYLIGAWGAIEAADTTFPVLGVPETWLTGVIFLAIVGLPIAIGAAWFYDLRRDRVDADPNAPRPLTDLQLRVSMLTAIAIGTTLLSLTGWVALRGPAQANAAALDMAPNDIAVMYFDDRTTTATLDYLAPSITEALITELAQVPALRVTSSNGVRRFRDRDAPLDEIGRTLRVGTIVTGNVSNAGKRVRVQVQLVDPYTGVVPASETVERAATDAFALIDELVAEVARFLRERIGERVAVRAFHAGTSRPEAWEHLQRARVLEATARKLQAAGAFDRAALTLMAADSLLAEAERIDGQYVDAALARASVARGRAFVEFNPMRGDMRPVIAAIDDGIAHATRVIDRNERHARALETRGTLRQLRLRFAPPLDPAERTQLVTDAERDLRAAIALDSTRARAYAGLSHILSVRGQLGEASVMAERAYQADAFLEDAEEILNRQFSLKFETGDDDGAVTACSELRRREAFSYSGAMCELMLRGWSPSMPADVDAAWNAVDIATRTVPPQKELLVRSHLETLAAAVLARARMPDSARAVLQRVSASGARDPELLQLEASVHVLLGDHAEAQRLMTLFASARGGVSPILAASRRFAALTSTPTLR